MTCHPVAHREWRKIESTISQDMSTLALYLRQWRLKLSGVGRSRRSSVWTTRRRNVSWSIDAWHLNFQSTTTYRALTRKLVGTGWGASPSTLRTFVLSLVYAPAEYCAPAWNRSRHASLLDVSLNCTLRIITGCLQPTPVERLPMLAGIPPTRLRGRAAGLALARSCLGPRSPPPPHHHQGRDAA